MDRARFDALARLLATRESRRDALAAVLGVTLLGHAAVTEAKRNRRRNRKGGKADRRTRGQAVPANCFTGSPCIPAPFANLASCDFSGGSALAGQDLRSVNLYKANLEDADITGANLSSVNFNGACLVDADLTGATTRSTNFTGAIRCRTTMPNGTVDNSGCNKGTRCCPTCIEEGETCGQGIAGTCCGAATCCNGRCRTGCCPATCQSLGVECGPARDGCGGVIDCGSCGDTAPICARGTCVTCAASCPDTECTLCINLVDGGVQCSGAAGLNCTECNTSTDCPNPEQAVCYRSYVNKSSGDVTTASQSCGNSGQLSACVYPSTCQPK